MPCPSYLPLELQDYFNFLYFTRNLDNHVLKLVCMEDECQTLKLTKSAKDLASFVLFITNCLEKSITVKTFRY